MLPPPSSSAVVTFDVNNAFNSGYWPPKVKALKNNIRPLYILKIISNYLSGRCRLLYDSGEGPQWYKVKLWSDLYDSSSGGVVQRSTTNVLAKPELTKMWNISKGCENLNIRENCIAFAEEQKLILIRKLCRTHKVPMVPLFAGKNTVCCF